MQKDVPLLPLVLIRHYSHPHCIEEAVYNYIKYVQVHFRCCPRRRRQRPRRSLHDPN